MKTPHGMFSAVTCVFQKDRFGAAAFLGIGFLILTATRLPVFHPALPIGEPIRPPGIDGSSVRAGLEQRLMFFKQPELEVAKAPVDLGSLEPKGRTTPDGSEVWGYPAGSKLEDLIEVHVKDGRVVREVLRPSPRLSASDFSES